MTELIPEKIKKRINNSFSLSKIEKILYKIDFEKRIKKFINEFKDIPLEPFMKEFAVLQTYEIFQYSKADSEAANYNIEALDTDGIKKAIMKLNFIKVWAFYHRMNITFPYILKKLDETTYSKIYERLNLFSSIKRQIYYICDKKGLLNFYDDIISKLMSNDMMLQTYLKELLRVILFLLF